MERLGKVVYLVEGDEENLKITTPVDLILAEAILQAQGGSDMTNLRIGHGYDVHRLTERRRLMLGGVEIPWDRGLLGHSDADVLTHAVMDALCGAARLGDIGKLFPDSDPRLRRYFQPGACWRQVAALLAGERMGRGEHRRHPDRPGPQGGPLPPGDGRRTSPQLLGRMRSG